jgi:predicted transcriptional regulator
MVDYVRRPNCDAEDWQLEEIAAGLAELDSGKMVEHEKVAEWLRSWGQPGIRKRLRTSLPGYSIASIGS